jgi:hypothetical protein
MIFGCSDGTGLVIENDKIQTFGKVFIYNIINEQVHQHMQQP